MHGHNINSACIYSRYANLILRCTVNILLKFIVLYFNNFLLLRPENLYVILARRHELPEDNILNVETCRSMLFVIIVFDITVQSLVKIVNKKIKNSQYHFVYRTTTVEFFVKRNESHKGGKLVGKYALGFLTKYIMNLCFNDFCWLLAV